PPLSHLGRAGARDDHPRGGHGFRVHRGIHRPACKAAEGEELHVRPLQRHAALSEPAQEGAQRDRAADDGGEHDRAHGRIVGAPCLRADRALRQSDHGSAHREYGRPCGSGRPAEARKANRPFEKDRRRGGHAERAVSNYGCKGGAEGRAEADRMRWPWQRRRRDDRRELRGIIYEAVAAGMSGVEASPEEAMRLATVYACVDRIASTISTLPVDLYEETPAGKRELREHPLAQLLRLAPNEFQTPADFFGYITRCMLIVGDAYVRIYRHEETGDVVRLLPIDPRRIETKLHPSKHRLIYYVDGDPLPPDSVWHIRGLPGRDYLQSASPIRAAAELIDAGRASVRLQRAVAENAAQPRD